MMASQSESVSCFSNGQLGYKLVWVMMLVRQKSRNVHIMKIETYVMGGSGLGPTTFRSSSGVLGLRA